MERPSDSDAAKSATCTGGQPRLLYSYSPERVENYRVPIRPEDLDNFKRDLDGFGKSEVAVCSTAVANRRDKMSTNTFLQVVNVFTGRHYAIDRSDQGASTRGQCRSLSLCQPPTGGRNWQSAAEVRDWDTDEVDPGVIADEEDEADLPPGDDEIEIHAEALLEI